MKALFLAIFGMLTTMVLAGPDVNVVRVPNGGLSPQAKIDRWDTLHLIFATGDKMQAKLHYEVSHDFGKNFVGWVPITETCIIRGNVRGPQFFVTYDGQPHFAWMKSSREFLHTRLTQTGSLNTEQNLIKEHADIDGGGTIVSGPDGVIYAVWHAPQRAGDPAESSRKVWVARSTDNGNTFEPATTGNAPERGACACCAVSALATAENLLVIYRCATDRVHRDMHLLTFDHDLKCEKDETLATLEANKCVMSTASFAGVGQDLYVAFETGSNIKINKVGSVSSLEMPGQGVNRKHPRLAMGKDGVILVAWTENTSFNQGGKVVYQFVTPDLKALDEPMTLEGLPAYSVPAVVAKADGSFIILY
ncbi:MAG TPA: hypothetical protein VF669_23525 [Tepidisphaeraceae bacterium]